jgi:ankyrin repeat protein
MNSMDQELFEAAQENNLTEVSRLLRAGADVNAKNGAHCDDTALHKASMNGYLPVVNELLDHGADTEALARDGETPLHFACWGGHEAVGNELLSRGANIDAMDDSGDTPLHLASTYDQLPVVKSLVSRGANILAANDAEQLPVHFAVEYGSSEVAKYLLQHFYATIRRLPLHELLQDLTWIGNPYGSDGDPPLREALDRDVLGTDDVVEILEYLVGRNPELLIARDQDGSLSLHVACRLGAPFPIVQSMVNLYEASVKCVTSEGDLPLFLACEMPETSLDTIFILMKLYPELVYR